MIIQLFIEKAILGEWKVSGMHTELIEVSGHDVYLSMPHSGGRAKAVIQQILLDPLAWQAVGKVEGWYCEPHNESTNDALMGHRRDDCADWKRKMHSMIGALAEGKTIEQYLETL